MGLGVLVGCGGPQSEGNPSSSSGSSGASGASASGAAAGSSSGASGGSSSAAGSTSSGAGSSSGAISASGSSGAEGGAAGCGDASCDAIPSGLLDPSRTTTWSPGILADDQLHLSLGSDGLPVRTTVCASPKPGDDLNAAINACPEGQVVSLAAGTYTVSATIALTKGVVLRGAGSMGAGAGGTTLVKTGGGSVVAIGSGQDTGCYASALGMPASLTQDAQKETKAIHVGSSAAGFTPGNLAIIDQVDDATVQEGDCQYFKRVDHRSISERVEVSSVDSAGGTLTLTTPLHWTFQSASPYLAQIARVTGPITRWAGLEGVSLQGGTNPGYDGQMAGGVDVSNAAYCWIKDVQTDATIAGMHIALTGTYRCVVRDSHFHKSANYGFGQDCYGIVLRCGAADDLVENNVVRYMNKPILFNVSGGGNVIGYNYADNSWATPAAWQEVNIDTHCSFPHMELMEGNYAPHMGATITHGNAGYLTYFRNYSSSQFASPAVAGATGSQNGNVTSLQFDSGDIDMTVVGNVLGSSASSDLGTAPVSATYIASGPGPSSIFELGDNANHNGVGMADVAYTSLWWHANYDTVSKAVVFNPSISARALPASLYLATRPAWWPAGNPWPWAGSDLTPMVGALPAKARSDMLGP